MSRPVITVVVPSLNQGQFLEPALTSIFQQNIAVEVFVLDGGSTDESMDILGRWAPDLAGWRSHQDDGQSAAINEGILMGTAPYVCWLNSDDFWFPGQLKHLLEMFDGYPDVPMVYGRVQNLDDLTGRTSQVWTEKFDESRLARRCIISQPATLIRRDAWIKVGGLNPDLKMAMDYDLWWRLYRQCGEPVFVDKLIAVNRQHSDTKTQSQRVSHYREAMQVVKEYSGSVPLKWWFYQPYSVWYKAALNWYRQR